MKAPLRRLGLTLAAVVVAAIPAAAQTTATVTGTLTDEATSAPLVTGGGIGYWVEVVRLQNGQSYTGSTNGSGQYTIANIPPGTYVVQVAQAGIDYIKEVHDNIVCVSLDCNIDEAGTPVVLGAGTTTTINFALARGGRIAGTVRRASNGQIIPVASVMLVSASGRTVDIEPTDPFGNYEFKGLPPGTYFADANGSGNAPDVLPELYGGLPCRPAWYELPCIRTMGTPIVVTGTATTSGIDFALDPTGTISGTVRTEETSAPMGGVFVHVYTGGRAVASVQTQSNGQYTLPYLLPGSYRVRTANVGNYIDEWYNNVCVGCAGTPATIAVTGGATAAGIDLSLAAGGIISGTVSCEILDSTEALQLPDYYVYNMAGELVRQQPHEGLCRAAQPSSTYQILGLPAGQYFVLARDVPSLSLRLGVDGGRLIDQVYPGITCVTADCDVRRGVPVTVAVGSTTSGINFAMAQGASSSTVPPPNPSLRLFDARGVELPRVQRTMNDFGAFAQNFVGVPPGTYFATFGTRLNGRGPCNNCAPTSGIPIVIAPGQRTFALDFGSATTFEITGTIRDEGGVPISNARLTLHSSNGEVIATAWTAGLGVYRMAGTLPGTYYIRTANERAFADEVYPGLPCAGCDVRIGTPIVVSNADVTGIDFTLAAGGYVQGSVVDTTNLGVGGDPVSFYMPDGTLVGKTTTAARGEYRVVLPPGTYRARAGATAGHGAEIYNEQPCSSAGCDVAAGAPIAVSAGGQTTNINFTPAACSAMTLSPHLLASGVVGQAYRQVFTVSGGTSPMAFQVANGLLPAGLTLTPGGLLSGTPTATGRHELVVNALDAAGCAAARTLTIDVHECIYRLSPATTSVTAALTNVPVVIGDSCGGQTITGAGDFVSVVSNTPSEVMFRVEANTGPARSRTLTIGRRVFVINQGGATPQPPFGTVDGPLDGAQVSGSMAVGGWALDDLEVRRVQVYRDPVGGEGASQIYLGDAVFVPGARPDVRDAYPSYPRNDRAGWGFLVLTNMLPNQGNGAYRIYVYAEDPEGLRSLLGARTIVASNATSPLPFGAIDTPIQGATVSGTAFINFGWALTPQPKIIPTDGSTIHVLIDGQSIGAPVYNQFRSDIAAAFPGLANSNGAVGYRILDTTALAEGQHTIAWIVADSQGAAAGIGSRYFSVANAVDSQPQAVVAGVESGRHPASLAETAAAAAPVRAERASGELRRVVSRDDGSHRIALRALEPLELQLEEPGNQECRATWAGYSVDGDALGNLPVGASIDQTGTFYWQPGPGFVGSYDLIFVRTGCDGGKQRLPVTVVIGSK
jgi:hypothetical protein